MEYRKFKAYHGFDCENKKKRNSTANLVLFLSTSIQNTTMHEAFVVQTPAKQCSQQYEQKLKNFHKYWNIQEFF